MKTQKVKKFRQIIADALSSANATQQTKHGENVSFIMFDGKLGAWPSFVDDIEDIEHSWGLVLANQQVLNRCGYLAIFSTASKNHSLESLVTVPTVSSRHLSPLVFSRTLETEETLGMAISLAEAPYQNQRIATNIGELALKPPRLHQEIALWLANISLSANMPALAAAA
ncbi:MAG TPA: hypothetical protein VMR76_02640 [Candidatus Saccharimonadia bacterium]|nr:hypothetical protein [Candidatus Saccharimonadia bacterium]